MADARTRLRQEIAKLRSLVSSASAVSSPLLISKDHCSMSPGTIVDAIRFESICRDVSGGQDWDLKRAMSDEAAALYREKLLTRHEIGWIEGECARYAINYESLILDYASVLLTRREFPQAELRLTNLLKLEPASEAANIALMQAYAIR